MIKIFRIAVRNLLRYRRRSLLTTLLITLGVVAVLLFVAVSASFKQLMAGQITDSMLGHVQIHKKGYISSIENLPLHLNLPPGMMARVEKTLAGMPEVEAWSPRVKLGAMLSNFTETTNVRLNEVDPYREVLVSPALSGRLLAGQATPLVEPGKLLLPELVAKGMTIKVGDPVVLVANNKDGSVNGLNFVVQGILQGISGPGGRDGYFHVEDARALLRMDESEVSEVAVRLMAFDHLDAAQATLVETLGALKNNQGKPACSGALQGRSTFSISAAPCSEAFTRITGATGVAKTFKGSISLPDKPHSYPLSSLAPHFVRGMLL